MVRKREKGHSSVRCVDRGGADPRPALLARRIRCGDTSDRPGSRSGSAQFEGKPMLKQDSLRVRDVDAPAGTYEAGEEAFQEIQRSQYDRAYDVNLRDYGSYSFPRFISAVLDKVDRDYTAADARLVDEMESPEVDFGLLLAYPDESLMFVGSDPTANDAIPWFAFVIEPMAPIPTPKGATDALDLLKPESVKQAVYQDDYLPDRHGEWWLLPTTMVPVGDVLKPGVSSQPYGPSPLGNHVPREYAFGVSNAEFMRRFSENVDAAPDSLGTVPEVIEWTWRQQQKVNPPDGIPDWADIRAWAREVLVRGTVRHRENDHFVENLGEQWHKATTHDIRVYTGDEVATNVHLDYHGR